MNKELDEQNESKAYLCGRLFAFICKLQFKAQSEFSSLSEGEFIWKIANAYCYLRDGFTICSLSLFLIYRDILSQQYTHHPAWRFRC